MIILDLMSNDDPVYVKTNSYFGKPFIWNTLLNFGGNSGIYGNLPPVASSMSSTLSNTTVIGVGLTMEGIWTNYIEFDLTLKIALDNETADLDLFVNDYAIRRYGLPHSISNSQSQSQVTRKSIGKLTSNQVIELSQKGWTQLKNTVYIYGGHIPKSMIVLTPSFSLGSDNNDLNSNDSNHSNKDSKTRSIIDSGLKKSQILKDTHIPYNIRDVHVAWQAFIEMGEYLDNVTQYRVDLVDITRQVLSDLFYKFYGNLTNYYKSNNISGVIYCQSNMMQLLTDMNNVLNTDAHWMIGPWLTMARKQANNVTSINQTQEADWWEFNARNQITIWGPDYKVGTMDYASKQWGGLVNTYYKERWKLFFDKLNVSMTNGYKWNQSQFEIDLFNQIEWPWQTQTNNFPSIAVNDSYIVACDIYKRWNLLGDTSCSL